jgi:hypothetical protein
VISVRGIAQKRRARRSTPAKLSTTVRAMIATSEPSLVRELRVRIHELELQNTDLKRQVAELRTAVVALMEPDMPRILRTPGGVMVLDAALDAH